MGDTKRVADGSLCCADIPNCQELKAVSACPSEDGRKERLDPKPKHTHANSRASDVNIPAIGNLRRPHFEYFCGKSLSGLD